MFPSPASEVAQLAGYHAVNSIQVLVREVGRLGELIDAATRAGAMVTGNFLFRLRDERTIRTSLLEEAVRDAREKADSLASALGKALGDPMAVAEDFMTFQISQPANGHLQSGFAASVPLTARLPLIAGQLMFWARVNVTYQFA